MSRVTGLKSDIAVLSNSDNDNKNWKSLLKTAKTNKIQYPSINNDLLKQHFNPNTNIIPMENAFAGYRICKNCGKPILLNSIMDHIQNHCPGSTDGGTSSSSASTLVDRDSASKTLPGTDKENHSTSTNGFSVGSSNSIGSSQNSTKNSIIQSNYNYNDTNKVGSAKNSNRRGDDDNDDDDDDDEDDEDDEDDDDEEDEDK